MSTAEAVAASVLFRLIQIGVFAVNYWVWRHVGASQAFAAGASVVTVLVVIPNWKER